MRKVSKGQPSYREENNFSTHDNRVPEIQPKQVESKVRWLLFLQPSGSVRGLCSCQKQYPATYIKRINNWRWGGKPRDLTIQFLKKYKDKNRKGGMIQRKTENMDFRSLRGIKAYPSNPKNKRQPRGEESTALGRLSYVCATTAQRSEAAKFTRNNLLDRQH